MQPCHLMKIIKNAFEGDFAKYLSEGKQVKVIITGSADAARMGRLAYDGRYQSCGRTLLQGWQPR